MRALGASPPPPGRRSPPAASFRPTVGTATPALKRAGYSHRPRTLPTGDAIDSWLPWSHIVLSNFKRWALDIFHGVSAAHLQAYLDEFCYRLNRRDQRPDLFRRILNRCLLYTEPATYALLTAT